MANERIVQIGDRTCLEYDENGWLKREPIDRSTHFTKTFYVNARIIQAEKPKTPFRKTEIIVKPPQAGFHGQIMPGEWRGMMEISRDDFDNLSNAFTLKHSIELENGDTANIAIVRINHTNELGTSEFEGVGNLPKALQR